MSKIQTPNRQLIYRFDKKKLIAQNTTPTKTNIKIYKFGEEGSGFRTLNGPQDFNQLRDEHFANKTLFEDPDFKAEFCSMYFSKKEDRKYEWKRPREIVSNPQFMVEDFSRFDIEQGNLGDCWSLAAIADLTQHPNLFQQIVPTDNFDPKYAGIFHFRFWQYGKWIDVVIDDRLPTYNGQLVYLHSHEGNEFWSALLEKAYAKLYGSYEALNGGLISEAMEDFTGGLSEIYMIQNTLPSSLYKIIIKAANQSSLIGCGISADPNIVEAQTAQGLVRGHAYSITKCVIIQTAEGDGKILLLRVRNPWGSEFEWNGAWSDGSPEWQSVPGSEKQRLGLIFESDGEFWIRFEDFYKYFNTLEICHLHPDSLSEEQLLNVDKKKWEVNEFHGKWKRGVSAGGSRQYLESYYCNPQYQITLTEVDEKDEQGRCTLIVALMQKNRRQLSNTGADWLQINFDVYAIPNSEGEPKLLDLNFFKSNKPIINSSIGDLREVSCRLNLPPGTYFIVPSTEKPNQEGQFLLRVFSENKHIMGYLDDAKK